MRVKLCGIRHEADLAAVVAADADAAGFLVGQLHASNDFILPSTAARLAGQLPPSISPVLVTHLLRASEIAQLVAKTGILTVQLHGGVKFCEVRKLRDKLPLNGKLILAVHVVDGTLDPEPEEFYPLIDAILLDSRNRATGQVGGTGRVHDWNTSAALVKRCPRPIILAGGLTPDNVAEAVRAVRPFAVDANTGLKGEADARDPGKCLAFVANAKAAAARSPSSPRQGE